MKRKETQNAIVNGLRDLGWTVEITERPINLFVIAPDNIIGFWVEVKSGRPYKLTRSKRAFFDLVAQDWCIVAVTIDNVLSHYERLARERHL